MLFSSGYTKVLFMKKNKDGDELHNTPEDTQPTDSFSGALICKGEMIYRVLLMKTVFSLSV